MPTRVGISVFRWQHLMMGLRPADLLSALTCCFR